MYMMFHNFEKKWSLGFLYDNPAIPEHLKIMLGNRDHLMVRELTAWLANHNVKAIAYCTGGLRDRIKSHRFIRQRKRYSRTDASGRLSVCGNL